MPHHHSCCRWWCNTIVRRSAVPVDIDQPDPPRLLLSIWRKKRCWKWFGTIVKSCPTRLSGSRTYHYIHSWKQKNRRHCAPLPIAEKAHSYRSTARCWHCLPRMSFQSKATCLSLQQKQCGKSCPQPQHSKPGAWGNRTRLVIKISSLSVS